jgi:5'(3')-deoxyribonucleotidase
VSRVRVLLDCDGVLADFVGAALVIINNLFDTSHTPADVWQFDIAASLGLSKEQGAAMKRGIGGAPRLSASLAVLPGSVNGVSRLRSIADVYIVTSSWDSNETWEFDRKAWLRRHFGIGHHEIVFTAAKHVCVGDFLVDDRTETLVEWQAAHPCGIAVQWQTPHNRRDAWSGISTSSWDELLALVGERT